MTVQKTTKWLTFCLLLCTNAALAPAQYQEFSEYDAQLFSPVNFDFNGRPLRKECGYFLRYDKISWAFTGDRVTIGDPNVNVLSENIFGNSGFSTGTAPQPYQIINGLQDAPPDAEFAWGERYELGYFNGNNGWLVGVLDGPESVSKATFGFGTAQLGDLEAEPEITAVTGSSGFGSVHVNFATPPDFLLGFRDYRINGDEENPPSLTLNGPGPRIIAVTIEEAETQVAGTFTDPQGNFFTFFDSISESMITDVTLSKIQDGITDDLDGDTFPGFFVVLADIDGDGMIDDDEIIGHGVDFDDLHMFNIRFNSFHVRNTTETQGIELMRTFELGNRHKMVKNQGNQASIAYGARFLRLRDSFFFQGTGGILGRTFAETSVENQIVGPQIRAKWSTQSGRWNLGVDGRFIFGYNVQDLEQVGAIGELLTPGALNSSAIGQPTAFAYGRQENDFSPVAELRADLSYQLTSSIAARLGYTAIFVDNITRASQKVVWALPNMGISPGHGQQEIFINGATFGFDLVY